jgi:hypothetical protein
MGKYEIKKQITGIVMFLFILMAFCGFSSASYVTDTLHYTSNFKTGTHYLESSDVTHYSTNHIRFHYHGIVQIWNTNTKHWQTVYTTNFYRDYQKTSSNKIIEDN